MMKKILDFTIVSNRRMGAAYSMLGLLPPEGIALADMDIRPGQFVQVDTGARQVMLRRPISVCDVNTGANMLYLLVRRAGKGTETLADMAVGAAVSVMLPLGNGFDITDPRRPLLAGGGVGVAPLLYLARTLAGRGVKADILIGARSAADVLLADELARYGQVHISTDDGSAGTPGVATLNPVFESPHDVIYCCGPLPMMKAVAAKAREASTACQVSLENRMACGVGACLCCVEDTADAGNVCVCTEGPVFNIDRLKW